MGIHEVIDDPWVLLPSVSLNAVDAPFKEWLESLGLEDLNVRAIVTADDDIHSEHDVRTTISNIALNALVGKVAADQSFADHLDQVRSHRQAASIGVRLVIDVTGDYPQTDAELTELNSEIGASVEHRNSPSHLIELSSPRAHELHHLIAGAVRHAVRRELHISGAAQSAWFLRPDGYPHFVLRVSGSARGIASTALPAGAVDCFPHVLDVALGDTRMRKAFSAYGQSMQYDLDPSLEFLSAFTALELLIKSRANEPPREPTAKRTGLAKKFETIADGDSTDCDNFDSLYARRNGLAHEARFNVAAGDQARALFGKYL